jgi:hypothetical protein
MQNVRQLSQHLQQAAEAAEAAVLVGQGHACRKASAQSMPETGACRIPCKHNDSAECCCISNTSTVSICWHTDKANTLPPTRHQELQVHRVPCHRIHLARVALPAVQLLLGVPDVPHTHRLIPAGRQQPGAIGIPFHLCTTRSRSSSKAAGHSSQETATDTPTRV